MKTEMKIWNVELCGTSLMGYIRDGITYDDLLRIFGESSDNFDDYKSDAGWCGTVNGMAFDIYNYKNGVNYNGVNGIELEDMEGKDWHIGGEYEEIVDLLNDYIEEQKKDFEEPREINDIIIELENGQIKAVHSRTDNIKVAILERNDKGIDKILARLRNEIKEMYKVW